jgi:hypothetical protein
MEQAGLGQVGRGQGICRRGSGGQAG